MDKGAATSRSQESLKDLALGKTVKPVFEYTPSILEWFATHKQSGQRSSQWVNLVCEEFTCLCPKTGAPDFARILINYLPLKRMVESKSLKLYLGGFRTFGTFHEDCVNTICQDLGTLLEPRYLEVKGLYAVRGGIAIQPFSWTSDNHPESIQIAKHRMLNHGI